MAINAYLQVPTAFGTALGQSTSDDQTGKIEIMQYSGNIEMTLTENTSSNVSRKAGRCKHDPLTIKKHVDNTTPLWHQHCSNGTVFDTITVHVFQQDNLAGNAAKTGLEFLTIAMQDVIVSTVTLTGEGDEMPTEEIKLAYNIVTWTYQQQVQGAQGGPAGKSTGMWNLEKNAAGGR